MCFCALFLPCTTCYYSCGCQDVCCALVSDECYMCDALAREDWSHVCCCLSEHSRLALCDVCFWYRVLCCAGTAPAVACESAVACELPAQAVPWPSAPELPAAASMQRV